MKNRPLPGAAVLLALTGAVHLWALSLFPHMTRDALQYVSASARWAEQGSYDLFYFPPLPCFLIKVLIQLGLAPETAGRTYCFLAGLFIPLVIYSLTLKTTSSRRLARYTALLAAVHPLLLYFSVDPMRDSLSMLLTVLAMSAGFTALKTQKLSLWLLCSVYTAAAWCCRFEALELMALAFICFAVSVFKKQYTRRKAVIHFLLYAFSSALLWLLLTVSTGGEKCFKYQYDNYILNKWNLFVLRWKA